MKRALLLVASAALMASPATASATPCSKLNEAQEGIAVKVMEATYPYACCDEKLTSCLKQKKVCKLAKRLRDDICRRVGRNQAPKAIKDALTRRARSMSALGSKAKIDLTGLQPAGDPKAPVKVVAYACARCPFCSKVLPVLHRLVVSGGLKGRAQLYFKAFPIRGHEGSALGGLAFQAAAREGKFWPYMLKLYAEFDKFSPERLPQWAASVKLDQAAFTAAMEDKSTRAALVAAKKEGLRNGVKATPTLFINGRKYHGDLDPETLLDVLDEEADRIKGKEFCQGATKGLFK